MGRIAVEHCADGSAGDSRMSKARIKYGNFAPEAKENFSIHASETAFDSLAQLNEYNLAVQNYANPCEKYQTILDGSQTGLPSISDNTGFWSRSISGDDGSFSSPIMFVMESERYFTSQSISFVFDKDNGVFCNHLMVSWFKDDALLHQEEYFPDSSEFSCVETVENYNAVTILFYSINTPFNRLKVRSIDHGQWRWFDGSDLRNIKILQEIDPISTKISINTADIELNIESDDEIIFQPNQPVEIYFNDVLHSATLTKDWQRLSKTRWKVDTEDYIGKMDGIDFVGGIYENYQVENLLSEIFNAAKVPFEIDSKVKEEKVSGYIPYTTCREALKQVCFSIGACADTSYSKVVRVKFLEDIITQDINLDRIIQGQKFLYDDAATSVEITTHDFKKTHEYVTAYDGAAGNGILVKFPEPLHDLTITGGEILKSNANYAVINAFENCQLVGEKYLDVRNVVSKRADTKYANVKEKIISVENATLVTSKNVDKILNLCYNFYRSNSIASFKIVEGRRKKRKFGSLYGSGAYGSIIYGRDGIQKTRSIKEENSKYGISLYGDFIFGSPSEYNYDKPVKVGEMIQFNTEYLGKMYGWVLRQTYNLNGGIIIKNSEIKRS